MLKEKLLLGLVCLFFGLVPPAFGEDGDGGSGNGLVRVDQVGYRPDDAKTAWFSGPGTDFSLVDVRTGESVFRGTSGKPVGVPESGEYISLVDFSAWRKEGAYYLDVPGTGRSVPFKIAKDAYADLFTASLKMLYYQRCGTELVPELAGDFSHASCHVGEAEIYGADGTMVADGGWHDAGDYGKYVVPGAVTAGHLLLAYELWPRSFARPTGIPESGSGVPDVLSEVRHELEWMLRMQDPSGGVYHKLTGRNFPGMDTSPDFDFSSLVISPVSYTATAGFGAVMAMAARTWKDIDSVFSATCLSAARKAQGWVSTRRFVPFANPAGILTGEYGDSNGQDEALWLYVELLRSTGEACFAAEVRNGLADPSFNAESFGWADTGMFGVTGILLMDDGILDSVSVQRAVNILENRVARLSSIADAAADRTMMQASDFVWGSNMKLMDQAMILLAAKRIDTEMTDASPALENLHYLLGRNSLGKCFVTGFGSDPVMNPHHRPSLAASVFYPVPGMVSGGPNANLEDPVAKNELVGKAPAKCFLDDSGSYSTNEVAVYWNSSLVFVLAALDQP